MQDIEEVGKAEAKVERGGIGVWVERDGPGVIQGQGEDNAFSCHHQEMVAEVGFCQDHNPIGLVQEKRGVSQSAFAEVTKSA